MKKWLLAASALALLATTRLTPRPAKADKIYDFAIMPKSLNNPYFDLARDGCMAEAAKLGNVKCAYTGPVNQDAAAQVQTVEDLITRGVRRHRDLGRRCGLDPACDRPRPRRPASRSSPSTPTRRNSPVRSMWARIICPGQGARGAAHQGSSHPRLLRR